MDEADLFAEAMGKVQRLHSEENKVSAVKKRRPRPTELVAEKRITAGLLTAPARDLSVQLTDDPWTLLADGVSRERLKKLASGQPAVATTIDLHGMTRDEALAVLEDAFTQALADGLRTLCLIHGRGLHSQGKAVLKEAVYHWLRQGMLAHTVLAVMPQPGSGGGACLVLLRRRQA